MLRINADPIQPAPRDYTRMISAREHLPCAERRTRGALKRRLEAVYCLHGTEWWGSIPTLGG